MRAASRGPARGAFQLWVRGEAVSGTARDAQGPWILAAKTVPPRAFPKGTSRRANLSSGTGPAVTATTGGSCETVCLIRSMAHLPLDGPWRTRKSEPTTACSTVDGLARCALAPGPAGSFRFVMTTGTPTLAGGYSPVCFEFTIESTLSTEGGCELRRPLISEVPRTP
jgi:hypothetical protein